MKKSFAEKLRDAPYYLEMFSRAKTDNNLAKCYARMYKLFSH